MDSERLRDYTTRITQANRSQLVVITFDLIIESIEEAKKVLTFLGVEAVEWVEINDFSSLMAMIGRQEARLMDRMGFNTTLQFKEIFNEKVSMQARATKLSELVAAINDNKQ